MIGRRAILGLTLTILVIVGFFWWNSNGRWRPVEVTQAQILDLSDRTRIEFYVPACNADLSAEVRETDGAVGVLISMRNVWRGMDCGGGLAVTLGEPLGNRELVDLSSLRPVDIAVP
jgi:hypothetical protein